MYSAGGASDGEDDEWEAWDSLPEPLAATRGESAGVLRTGKDGWDHAARVADEEEEWEEYEWEEREEREEREREAKIVQGKAWEHMEGRSLDSDENLRRKGKELADGEADSEKEKAEAPGGGFGGKGGGEAGGIGGGAGGGGAGGGEEGGWDGRVSVTIDGGLGEGGLRAVGGKRGKGVAKRVRRATAEDKVRSAFTLQSSSSSSAPFQALPPAQLQHQPSRTVNNHSSSSGQQRSPLSLSTHLTEGLHQAVARRGGSAEEIAALSVALFRALGFTARCSLSPSPLKPTSQLLSEFDPSSDTPYPRTPASRSPSPFTHRTRILPLSSTAPAAASSDPPHAPGNQQLVHHQVSGPSSGAVAALPGARFPKRRTAVAAIAAAAAAAAGAASGAADGAGAGGVAASPAAFPGGAAPAIPIVNCDRTAGAAGSAAGAAAGRGRRGKGARAAGAGRAGNIEEGAINSSACIDAPAKAEKAQIGACGTRRRGRGGTDSGGGGGGSGGSGCGGSGCGDTKGCVAGEEEAGEGSGGVGRGVRGGRGRGGGKGRGRGGRGSVVGKRRRGKEEEEDRGRSGKREKDGTGVGRVTRQRVKREREVGCEQSEDEKRTGGDDCSVGNRQGGDCKGSACERGDCRSPVVKVKLEEEVLEGGKGGGDTGAEDFKYEAVMDGGRGGGKGGGESEGGRAVSAGGGGSEELHAEQHRKRKRKGDEEFELQLAMAMAATAAAAPAASPTAAAETAGTAAVAAAVAGIAAASTSALTNALTSGAADYKADARTGRQSGAATGGTTGGGATSMGQEAVVSWSNPVTNRSGSSRNGRNSSSGGAVVWSRQFASASHWAEVFVSGRKRCQTDGSESSSVAGGENKGSAGKLGGRAIGGRRGGNSRAGSGAAAAGTGTGSGSAASAAAAAAAAAAAGAGAGGVGRWVHVDGGRGVVDGEEKVEGLLMGMSQPLTYVVGLAGGGAKDVTRRVHPSLPLRAIIFSSPLPPFRYAARWSLISPLRDEAWWSDNLPCCTLLCHASQAFILDEAWWASTLPSAAIRLCHASQAFILLLPFHPPTTPFSYAARWSLISPLRDEAWWASTLSPLRSLEAAATAANRFLPPSPAPPPLPPAPAPVPAPDPSPPPPPPPALRSSSIPPVSAPLTPPLTQANPSAPSSVTPPLPAPVLASSLSPCSVVPLPASMALAGLQPSAAASSSGLAGGSAASASAVASAGAAERVTAPTAATVPAKPPPRAAATPAPSAAAAAWDERAAAEDMEMDVKQLTEPLPSNQQPSSIRVGAVAGRVPVPAPQGTRAGGVWGGGSVPPRMRAAAEVAAPVAQGGQAGFFCLSHLCLCPSLPPLLPSSCTTSPLTLPSQLTRKPPTPRAVHRRNPYQSRTHILPHECFPSHVAARMRATARAGAAAGGGGGGGGRMGSGSTAAEDEDAAAAAIGSMNGTGEGAAAGAATGGAGAGAGGATAEDASSPSTITIELFGEWQTDTWRPPPAVDGRIPKNERGQVEVWSEKCLPPGTVHLRLPRLVTVVQRLGFDFAPAVVGFEWKGGKAMPKYEGLVVCAEHADTIVDVSVMKVMGWGGVLRRLETPSTGGWWYVGMPLPSPILSNCFTLILFPLPHSLQAYTAEEQRQLELALQRRRNAALERWHVLIGAMITRQRLQDTYEAAAAADSAAAAGGGGGAGGAAGDDGGDGVAAAVGVGAMDGEGSKIGEFLREGVERLEIGCAVEGEEEGEEENDDEETSEGGREEEEGEEEEGDEEGKGAGGERRVGAGHVHELKVVHEGGNRSGGNQGASGGDDGGVDGAVGGGVGGIECPRVVRKRCWCGFEVEVEEM
ncbi:unnamed protein product [Closterium sp. NIES-54]